ncbi:AMP-binding protein [Sulfitobacter porphyrae]|uniref:AMP-binding protein n=1 Tax=Sulfitobacter porphyrae TaxID=1246864 RepID=A0ABW2B7X0_9RHOB
MNTPLDGADISSIRLCHAGGAAMPVEAAKAVQDTFGVQIVEGWGMTELHGFGTMNPAVGECRIGSVGHRLPFVELCVADVADDRVQRVCDPDEVGHVLVRGGQLLGGYLDPAHEAGVWITPSDGETRPDWSKGGDWFDTGDLGRIDADGYVWLTGRSKDAIIRGGHNIDPLTIEEVLYAHPAVEVAAAVGQPDVYAGELPVAFVQLREGQDVDAETLRDFARERIAERAAAPVRIFVTDTIPLTAVGKIFKPTLRELAASQVITEALADVAPDARVTARQDKRRGLVVTVALPDDADPVTAEAARAVLSGFALQFDLVGAGLPSSTA